MDVYELLEANPAQKCDLGLYHKHNKASWIITGTLPESYYFSVEQVQRPKLLLLFHEGLQQSNNKLQLVQDT